MDKIWIDIGYSYVLFSNEECWMLPSFVKNGYGGGLGKVNKTIVGVFGGDLSGAWLGSELTLLLRYTKTTD